MVLVKNWQLFSTFLYQQKRPGKYVCDIFTSLVRLEIRSRNEESINPRRNRIYSLKIFYSLVYRRRYFLFVSKLI